MARICEVAQFDLANIGDEPADDVGHCGRDLDFVHRKLWNGMLWYAFRREIRSSALNITFGTFILLKQLI